MCADFYVNIRVRLVTLVILRQDICSGCVGSIGFGVGCDFVICSGNKTFGAAGQEVSFYAFNYTRIASFCSTLFCN